MESMIESAGLTYGFKDSVPSVEKFADKVTAIVQEVLPFSKVIRLGPMIVYLANLYEDGTISGTIAMDATKKQIVSTRVIEITGNPNSSPDASVSRTLSGKVESKLSEIFPDLQKIG